MSPTIPILSALLLSLISGSTEGGQRTDPVPLLRQTLQYWWKIYKTYSEEVTLGYCWAGYLLQIGSELPTNLSASSPAATRDCSDTIAGTTGSQQNLFPRGVMATAVTPLREAREGKHPREKRSHARSAISRFISDSGERRVAARSKRIQRRRAHPIVTELSREAPQDGHEFSSRGSSSHAVNPTPNPRDDDKVDFGSTALGQEDSRRKVLRSLTSRRDSSVAFASRSFSLKVTREESLGGQRFLFRRYSASRKRNSKVDEADRRMPREDPAGHLGPLNDEESSSRSQFRRADCPRTSAVKLMDSEGNSSCDPTINSTTPRREPEELSRDSPSSLRGGSAERPFLESRGGGGETVKRNALLRFETASGSDTKMRPRERGSSRDGRDVSTIHPYFSSEFRRSRQRTPRENRGFPSDATIPRKSRGGDLVRVARSAASLPNIGHFVGDYKDSGQSAQHSPTASQAPRDPNQLSLAQQSAVGYGIRSLVIAVFRTLGTFVQVGRQVIDVVQTNAALDCTREYLWTKFVKWIE